MRRVPSTVTPSMFCVPRSSVFRFPFVVAGASDEPILPAGRRKATSHRRHGRGEGSARANELYGMDLQKLYGFLLLGSQRIAFLMTLECLDGLSLLISEWGFVS